MHRDMPRQHHAGWPLLAAIAVLNLNLVPETPSSFGLIGSLGLLVLFRRRRV